MPIIFYSLQQSKKAKTSEPITMKAQIEALDDEVVKCKRCKMLKAENLELSTNLSEEQRKLTNLMAELNWGPKTLEPPPALLNNSSRLQPILKIYLFFKNFSQKYLFCTNLFIFHKFICCLQTYLFLHILTSFFTNLFICS